MISYEFYKHTGTANAFTFSYQFQENEIVKDAEYIFAKRRIPAMLVVYNRGFGRVQYEIIY